MLRPNSPGLTVGILCHSLATSLLTTISILISQISFSYFKKLYTHNSECIFICIWLLFFQFILRKFIHFYVIVFIFLFLYCFPFYEYSMIYVSDLQLMEISGCFPFGAFVNDATINFQRFLGPVKVITITSQCRELWFLFLSLLVVGLVESLLRY